VPTVAAKQLSAQLEPYTSGMPVACW